MQEDICMLGIGIETNPSSNYLIGTFRRYDKHPIVGWYNYGLTLDFDAMQSVHRCKCQLTQMIRAYFQPISKMNMRI